MLTRPASVRSTPMSKPSKPGPMRVCLVESLFDAIEGDTSDPESPGPMPLFIPAGTCGTVKVVTAGGSVIVNWDTVMLDNDVTEGWEWAVTPKQLRSNVRF